MSSIQLLSCTSQSRTKNCRCPFCRDMDVELVKTFLNPIGTEIFVASLAMRYEKWNISNHFK